jgi:hypothetical protein
MKVLLMLFNKFLIICVENVSFHRCWFIKHNFDKVNPTVDDSGLKKVRAELVLIA